MGCSQARAKAGQTREGRECVSVEASHVVHTDPHHPHHHHQTDAPLAYTIILLHVSPLAVLGQLLSHKVSASCQPYPAMFGLLPTPHLCHGKKQHTHTHTPHQYKPCKDQKSTSVIVNHHSPFVTQIILHIKITNIMIE